MLKFSLYICRKDLTLIAGRSTGLVQALLLGLLLVFVFSLTQGLAEEISAQAAATIFWLASVFAQVLIFNAIYALEEENGQKYGLQLSPAPAQSIWLGKALSGLILLLAAQIIFIPAIVVFLNQQLTGGIYLGLTALILTDIGLVAVGSLLGALAQGQATRESLLSVIIFPLLLPLLLAAIRLGAAVFSGTIPEGAAGWIKLSLAFDALFLGAGLLLFNFVYDSQE